MTKKLVSFDDQAEPGDGLPAAVKAALNATYAPSSLDAKNPLTGMYHAHGFGPRNATSINAALDAVRADPNGGTVYVDAGLWAGNETIDLTGIQGSGWSGHGNTVGLRGAGKHQTRIVGGEAAYGLLDMVDSVSVTVEGVTFEAPEGGTLQYGIVGGRTTGDRSAGRHLFRDVSVYGNFITAAIFMLNAETCHYQDMTVTAMAGAGVVLARDTTDWPIVAKYLPLSSTPGYPGGNGGIVITNGWFYCYQTTTSVHSKSRSPLVVEFPQALLVNKLYTVTCGGQPHIVFDKGMHHVTLNGLQQEFYSQGGAVAGYGVMVLNNRIGAEAQAARLHITASTMFALYGADNLLFTDLSFKATGFKNAANISYEIDVWDTEPVDITRSAANTVAWERTTPRARRRSGGSSHVTRDEYVAIFGIGTSNQQVAVPRGARSLTIKMQGAGGGGGAGRRGAPGAVVRGGNAGASGGYTSVEIDVSKLTVDPTVGSPKLIVNVGNGGVGGAAATADSTNGGWGATGGESFVSHNGQFLARASGGGGGSGGGAVTVTGGDPGMGQVSGVAGALSSETGGAGASPTPASSAASASGGAGGGINVAGTASAGGAGGGALLWTTTGGAGAAPGNPGGAGGTPTVSGLPGSGGGGGGASTTAVGGAGGAGGLGAGGGGGGASQNGLASGAGGAGGSGYIMLVARF